VATRQVASLEEILIGDDLEADPLIYAAYADILAGHLAGATLRSFLCDRGVLKSDANAIVRLVELLPGGGRVRRAYIRLERNSDADQLLALAPGVVACLSAFQMAVDLFLQGQIALSAVTRVAAELHGRGRRREFEGELRELYRRALVDKEAYAVVGAALRDAGLVSVASAASLSSIEIDPRWKRQQEKPPAARWID
jgi:hypothetical protein